MSPVFINGYSLSCALGDDVNDAASGINTPAQPKPITFCLDDEEITVNYFSAFQQRLLSESLMFAEIESHILAAMKMAGWHESELAEIPIFLGSTSYLISSQERRLLTVESEEWNDACYKQPFTLNLVAHFFRDKYSNQNVFTFATSCTSSANALLYAKKYLNLNFSERAIIVGFESFNSLTVEGFYGLGLLAQHNAQPFSENSDGLVLGEGIACIAISQHNSLSLERKITLAGGATQGDTYNITSTLPSGDNVAQVISDALLDANITAEYVKGVKAHGTGGPANDRAEGLGILQQFPSSLPVMLLKPYIGHTLGACGVLECALMVKYFVDQKLPVLPEQYHSEIDLPLNVIKDGATLEDGYYLLNYLGFGGNNTILVMGVNV